MTKTVTWDRLKELLDFDPATGWFTWKNPPSRRVKAGDRAGVVHKPTGGRYLTLDGERYMAHRVAWFYVKGAWPEQEISPLNGDYDDCRIENLAEVSRSELQHRRGAQSNNSSGFLGVSWSVKTGKWQAAVTWNYRQRNLGANFETAEEASEVYQMAVARLRETKTDEEVEAVLEGMRLFKRQRSIWKHLQRLNRPLGWATFEEFAADITEVPAVRYAMSALDESKPLGPGNYKWMLPIDAELNSSKDRLGYVRAINKANREHFRAKHLKKEYGAEWEYERKKLVEQNGLCAVCGKPEEISRGREERRLSLDHDHKTGALRGLLCGNCNMGIGYLCDDPEVLSKAIEYLKKYSNEGEVKA